MKLTLSAGLFFIALTSLSISQPANPYIFCPAVKITAAPPDDGSSSDFTSSGQHYTAFRGDTVYVVWAETRFSTPPVGNHVLFSKSTDKGRTFRPNVRVNSTPSGFNPSMRMDTAGIIYVAYERQANIYFTKSIDGGNTFSPATVVVDSAGLPYGQGTPSIAVNGRGQVFIAWVDYRTDPQSIFTAASYDGGQTFGQNVQGSDSGYYAYSCDISVDESGKVYVVWPEFVTTLNLPLRLARGNDSGKTFPFRTTVSDLPIDTGQVFALDPTIAVGEGGNIGIAWEDKRYDQYTIHFSSSADYGQTFSPSIRVDEDTDTYCCPQPGAASLAWKNGSFYIAFVSPSSHSSPKTGAYFTYRPSDTGIFAANVNASEADDSVIFVTGNTSLAVNENGEVFVAWRDNRYDPYFGEIRHMFGALGKTTVEKGDLNLDCVLTPADVVMELNAVFAGQSFPAPFQNADGNCSGDLTPTDVVLLLKAVFQSQSFPCS